MTKKEMSSSDEILMLQCRQQIVRHALLCGVKTWISYACTHKSSVYDFEIVFNFFVFNLYFYLDSMTIISFVIQVLPTTSINFMHVLMFYERNPSFVPLQLHHKDIQLNPEILCDRHNGQVRLSQHARQNSSRLMLAFSKKCFNFRDYLQMLIINSCQ